MSLQQTFSKIIITNSDGPGAVPLASDLSHGELAINYNDGNLYFKNANNEIQVASSTSDNATTKEHIEKVYDPTAVSPTNPHGITASLLGLSPFKNQTLLGLPINTATTNALVTKASASSVNNLITLSGASENSQDLGEFSGSIILDNSSIKGALQNLETHLDITDSIADTNVIKITNLITLSGVSKNSQGLGSFSGGIINDNKTIKQALQELENEVTSLGNASFGSTNDGGIELGTGASATFGGAVGKGATTTTGGAIGEDAEATMSGFAGGKNAKAYTSGGAVGSDTEATTGGAIGHNAKTTTGGAVGANAESKDGFAGGKDANCLDADGGVQLGTGINTLDNTIQFRSSGSVTESEFGELTTISERYTNIDNLVSLSGVSENSAHLGTFNGNTISDNSAIKGALQDIVDNKTIIEDSIDAVIEISDTSDIHNNFWSVLGISFNGVYYRGGLNDGVEVHPQSAANHLEGSPIYYRYDESGNINGRIYATGIYATEDSAVWFIEVNTTNDSVPKHEMSVVIDTNQVVDINRPPVGLFSQIPVVWWEKEINEVTLSNGTIIYSYGGLADQQYPTVKFSEYPLEGNSLKQRGNVIYYDSAARMYLSSTVSEWSQIGSDIDGKAAGDQSGRSVSMNAAGDIVAIGASGNDDNGPDSGHVRVYQNIGGTWTQIGDDIGGEAAGDYSGVNVSMNAVGDIVAIGAYYNGSDSGHVRVYQNIAGTWTRIGFDIDGGAAFDQSGRSVSINAAGDIVAIGASGNDDNGPDSGHVRVYQFLEGTWTQIGTAIDGEAAYDGSGWSVSMNAVGDIVAIGAHYNDNNGSNSGHVRVYQNIDGTWTRIGSDIDGKAAGDYSGDSVSINAAGDIVAIGAFGNDDNGSNSGHVRVYQNIGGTWTQIGDDIEGEAADDYSGIGVSMNDAGDIVAIGALNNDDNGSNSGHVRLYQNIGGTWTQIGDDIDGEAAYDGSGYSVSINAVGDIVAIGATGNDGNGSGSGHVRVLGFNYANNESVLRTHNEVNEAHILIQGLTSRIGLSPNVSGSYSTHMGSEGTASGSYSTHMGSEGTASGSYSTHMGINGIASGSFSTHIGYSGTASGDYSTHMGRDGLAEGNYSVHLGNNGTAKGAYSTHMGYNGLAEGNYSTHMGSSGTAGGNHSTHMGVDGVASGTTSTHMGFDGEASGSHSTHMGSEGTASESCSTHMGFDGVASGIASTHMGRDGTANGYASVHMGRAGEASADYSTHMGSEGKAKGNYSTHMGFDGVASGIASTHMGRDGTANGYASVHMGNGGTASAFYSTHMGRDGIASRTSQVVIAGEKFAVNGDRQYSVYQLRAETSDATETKLTESFVGDELDEAFSVFFETDLNKTYSIEINLLGRSSDGAWNYSGKYHACITSGATGDPALVGTLQAISEIVSDESSTTRLVVAFDNGENSMVFKVTGKAATNIRWNAVLQINEVGF